MLFSFFLNYGQEILWEKSLGGRHADYLMDAQATPDYGFILAGSSLSKNSGNKIDDNEGDLDYWIWKMDENGELEWQKSFGGSGTDLLQSVELTIDGGFILAGTSNSNKSAYKIEDGKGLDDFWVIKLNAGGGQQWQRTIGGSGQEKLQRICQTKDGGYILGGSSDSDKSGDKQRDSYGSLDYWVLKLDNEGKIEWQQTIGGIYLDELRSLDQTIDSGYILGGYSNSPKSGVKSEDNIGVGDYWIVKLDKRGNVEWQRTIGGNRDDQLQVIHQSHDKGFLLAGSSDSESTFEKRVSNGKGSDFWVVKLKQDGEIFWQETYDIGKTDILTSLFENADGSILLGGFAKSEEEIGVTDYKGINDYVAIKIKENGEECWRKSVGSSGEDILKKVIETRDGGYLLAGASNATKKGGSTFGNYKQSYPTAKTLKIGNGKNIKAIEEGSAYINDQVKQFNDEVNTFYKEKIEKVTDKINETANNINKDSRLKMGMSTSAGNLLNNNSPIGSGNGNDFLSGLAGMNDDKLPNSQPSGDKMRNYGFSDFWIVKLKDKLKSSKIKANIEAFPNPTKAFTNVIIGFEFEKGSATVVDLGGHVLEQFEIKSRTVPVNMSNYPEGIYIVNIRTDKGKESVKIIKNNK
ncbi:T9SS type A sorting domain-containing protein [Flavobacterium sp. CYK-4]|nr:T9SS type A sorting domain-containing protein [Flavobacterium lotistagni]